MSPHGIRLTSPALTEFGRRWAIRRLDVFGSVLRDDFAPDSDIDILFSLEDESSLTFGRWAQMEAELSAILGRRVDLVPRRSVEASDNPYRRQHILQTAEPIYVAGDGVAA